MIFDFELTTSCECGQFAFVRSSEAYALGEVKLNLWDKDFTMFCVRSRQEGEYFQSMFVAMPRTVLDAASFTDCPIKIIVNNIAQKLGFAFVCDIATRVSVSFTAHDARQRLSELCTLTGLRWSCQHKQIVVEAKNHVAIDYVPEKLDFDNDGKLRYLGDDLWFPQGKIVLDRNVQAVRHTQIERERKTELIT